MVNHRIHALVGLISVVFWSSYFSPPVMAQPVSQEPTLYFTGNYSLVHAANGGWAFATYATGLVNVDGKWVGVVQETKTVGGLVVSHYGTATIEVYSDGFMSLTVDLPGYQFTLWSNPNHDTVASVPFFSTVKGDTTTLNTSRIGLKAYVSNEHALTYYPADPNLFQAAFVVYGIREGGGGLSALIPTTAPTTNPSAVREGNWVSDFAQGFMGHADTIVGEVGEAIPETLSPFPTFEGVAMPVNSDEARDLFGTIIADVVPTEWLEASNWGITATEYMHMFFDAYGDFRVMFDGIIVWIQALGNAFLIWRTCVLLLQITAWGLGWKDPEMVAPPVMGD